MRILALLLPLFGFQSIFPPCRWGKPAEIGSLEKPIDEASGLAISVKIPDRLYHINDSDITGRFFITNMAGRNTRTVYIRGFRPTDTEDLAIGPCDPTTDCLFIGDIGDNDRVRKDIEIIVIEERVDFPAEVGIRNRVRARYPDAPHDAESMAVHPDGNIYILTKNLELHGLRPLVGPVRLYRLRRDQWRNSRNEIETMELVMTLDFAKLLPGALLGGRLPTGMDISPDGKRFLVLTYQDAAEFFVDLSTLPTSNEWKEGQHYRRIPLLVLAQQEAISFTPDGNAFIYTTERKGTNARMVEVKCTE
jgi:WD40-like Beta Propeller Repeat